MEEGQEYERELRFLRAHDNQWRWHLCRALPMRNSRGNIVRWFGTCTDIHEKKQREEHLVISQAELEQRIEDRTSALQRANAALAVSNQDLEQFAYVASHDLREPLRMISSYTQLLLRRLKVPKSDEAWQYTEFVTEGVARMERLISDLLEYSRIGKGRQLSKELDGSKIVEAARNNLRQMIDETDALIETGPLPTLMGNEAQLVSLFQNLIGNAVKFHKPDTRPQVEISAEPAPATGYCLFRVRDNGIGIKKEYLDRIFMIFQRLHTRSEYPGTGIGLTICKKIVETHGGRMWAESEEGQGTTFFFTLPGKMA